MRCSSFIPLVVLLTATCAFAGFEPPVFYDLPSLSPSDMVVRDMDGDGIVDLVVSGYDFQARNPGIAVLLGKADATYNVVSTKFTVPGHFSESPLAVGDLNGDSIPDVAVGADNMFLVAFGNGDGTFQTPTSYPGGGGSTVHVIMADLNEDGALDVAESLTFTDHNGLNHAQFRVFLNQGDGTLIAGYTGTSGINLSGGAIAVGDFNQDGHLDVVTSNLFSNFSRAAGGASGDPMYIFLGNGDGTFQSPGRVQVAQGFPQVGDVNRDGNPDIILVSQDETNAAIYFFPGNGDGSFGGATVTPTGLSLVNTSTLFFLGGQKPEEIIADHSGVLLQFIGDVDGVFTLQRAFKVPKTVTSVVVDDLNADGRPDLILADSQRDKITIFMNQP